MIVTYLKADTTGYNVQSKTNVSISLQKRVALFISVLSLYNFDALCFKPGQLIHAYGCSHS